MVVLLALATASLAASKEPFLSFRYIDRQLSVLNQGAAELKTNPNRLGRSRALRQMRLSARRIQQRSGTLKRLYRSRGSRYGVKTFTAMDRDAIAVERALDAVQHNKGGADATLEKATLALVLRYQAVTSNYGANHCDTGQWACCEPRRDPETNRESGMGCRWMCAGKPRSCSGFLGPRTLR